MWSRVRDWPDPVAVVQDTPIARKDLLADLQAEVDGGVLTNDVDEVTGLRAAATALEARIDAVIVHKAVPTGAILAVERAAQSELVAEQTRAGGRDLWLKAIARRGQSEEGRKRSLLTQAGLDALVAKDVPPATEADLRERYEHNQKLLTLPAAVRVREISVPTTDKPGSVLAGAAETKLSAQVLGDQLTTPTSGWLTRRELGPERWAAVANLKVGLLTPIVRTSFGVHRLQVIEHRAERKQSWAEAKVRLAAYVERFRTFEAGHKLLLKLRAAAKVQRFSPFDHPPGGLPLAGDVTVGAFEEDDD